MKRAKQSKAETPCAKDIMSRHPTTVGPDESLQTAMDLMVENHVTGLPVVDEAERCVGIVSATDILQYEQDHAESAGEVKSDVARYFDQTTQRWEDVRVTSYALEKFGELQIEEVMSHDLIFVPPQTPVRTVAQKMLDQHVHRVLVLDRENHLLGLITATDFVRLATGHGSTEQAG